MALLEIENLIVAFPSRTATGRAVDGVSITVAEGESLGVEPLHAEAQSIDAHVAQCARLVQIEARRVALRGDLDLCCRAAGEGAQHARQHPSQLFGRPQRRRTTAEKYRLEPVVSGQQRQSRLKLTQDGVGVGGVRNGVACRRHAQEIAIGALLEAPWEVDVHAERLPGDGSGFRDAF